MMHRDGALAAGEGATKRKVGRPPIITRPDIERAGRELTREGGLDAVTVSALAGRLQVTTRALYHHIDGRDELRSMVVQAVLAEVEHPDPDHDPPTCVLALLDSLGSVLADHHGVAGFLLRNGCQSQELWDLVERMVTDFCRAGVDPPEALRRAGALVNWQFMTSLRDELAQVHGPSLEIAVDPDRHPTVMAAYVELGGGRWMSDYERDLLASNLIDGL